MGTLFSVCESFMARYIHDPKIFLCPGDKDNQINKLSNTVYNNDNSFLASYSTTQQVVILPYPGPEPDVLELNNPSTTSIVWDILGGNDYIRKEMNHGLGGNVLYYDGHVEWREYYMWQSEDLP